MQSMLFLFLNVHMLLNVYWAFFGGGGVFFFFFNEKEMYSFFPTVGHEINLLDLDSYLG